MPEEPLPVDGAPPRRSPNMAGPGTEFRDHPTPFSEEIILSGFGGQGALFAGLVLAYAGMDSGKYVTWIPSYGPEMRGGTAHVTVIIADEPIGSPLVRDPSVALALNNPSMEKYEPLLRVGGLLVYNSSLISRAPSRTDTGYVAVPATDVATEIGDVRVANMVALGALVEATGVLSLEAVIDVLYRHLPEDKRSFLPLNEQALKRGAGLVEPLAAKLRG
jgi:2-oxoglutarate ferredoxin oxidoreductase subunit gamma